MPSFILPASVIMCWFHGGSHTSATLASETPGIIRSLLSASAAMLGNHVTGRSVDELVAARDALSAYLKGEAETPGDWPGLDLLAPARPHKARHGSIMLAFQATAEAAVDAAALNPSLSAPARSNSAAAV